MNTISLIPSTEFSQIIQTKSSPEIIVALLDEAERKHSKWRKTLPDGRLFLSWKICPVCSVPFLRNTKHLERVKIAACSRQCNGRLRGEDFKAHAHKGRAAWSTDAERSFRAHMTGSRNPAWKDGVTYRRRRGNYVSVRYVRCPPEYLSMARKDGYVMEHRLVVAQAISRPLTRAESVHHDNHNPLDNRPANLMLFKTNRDHKLFEHGTAIMPIWSGLPPKDIKARFGASKYQLVLL